MPMRTMHRIHGTMMIDLLQREQAARRVERMMKIARECGATIVQDCMTFTDEQAQTYERRLQEEGLSLGTTNHT